MKGTAELISPGLRSFVTAYEARELLSELSI